MTTPLDGPNVVLVVMDTVRADHLASYGYHRVTTPELERFAAEHMTRFTQAHSTGPWTLPSHGSLFTGLYPAEHGATTPRNGIDDDTIRLHAWPAQPIRPEVPTLAERLGAAGYRTGGIVANSFYLRHELGMGRGFQHWDDRHRGAIGDYFMLFQTTGAAPWLGHRGYRDGGDITTLALDWLDRGRGGEPFFLFLNYFDAHFPYLPPPPFDRAFDAPRIRDPMRAGAGDRLLLYDRELRHLDHHLGRLLDGLVERDLLDGTLLIVTSDHGEAFGEHGIWAHSWSLHEELLHVPLFLRPPQGRRGPVDETPITGAQLHDLILSTVGLQPPERDHADEVEAEFYWGGGLRMEDVERMERAWNVDLERDLVSWFEGGRKFIVASTGAVTAYDLALDPGERTPLELSPAAETAARDRANAWWAAHPPPAPARVEFDGGASTLRALQDVGYAGD